MSRLRQRTDQPQTEVRGPPLRANFELWRQDSPLDASAEKAEDVGVESVWQAQTPSTMAAFAIVISPLKTF